MKGSLGRSRQGATPSCFHLRLGGRVWSGEVVAPVFFASNLFRSAITSPLAGFLKKDWPFSATVVAPQNKYALSPPLPGRLWPVGAVHDFGHRGKSHDAEGFVRQCFFADRHAAGWLHAEVKRDCRW